MSDSLTKKLILLKEVLEKAMSNSGLGGPGSVKAGAVLPNKTFTVQKLGHNSMASKVNIPSVAPQSKKDPIKSIQQVQNKDIKDLKMKEAQARFGNQVIKFEENGQWNLDKSRCWEGYEPTPGKKPYEDGSCRPKSLKKEECECEEVNECECEDSK
jgi:hypothetical protein